LDNDHRQPLVSATDIFKISGNSQKFLDKKSFFQKIIQEIVPLNSFLVRHNEGSPIGVGKRMKDSAKISFLLPPDHRVFVITPKKGVMYIFSFIRAVLVVVVIQSFGVILCLLTDRKTKYFSK